VNRRSIQLTLRPVWSSRLLNAVKTLGLVRPYRGCLIAGSAGFLVMDQGTALLFGLLRSPEAAAVPGSARAHLRVVAPCCSRRRRISNQHPVQQDAASESLVATDHGIVCAVAVVHGYELSNSRRPGVVVTRSRSGIVRARACGASDHQGAAERRPVCRWPPLR